MNSPLQKLKSSSKTRTTALHKAFLAAGLLSGSALSSIVFTAPARAESCVAAGMTVATVVTSGFTCTSGDKLYSNFFNNGPNPLGLGDQVSIAAGIPNHTISVQNASGWGIGTYALQYTISVIGGSGGPGSYNPYLQAFSTSSSSSIFGPPAPAGTFTVSSLHTPSVSVAVNGGLGGPQFYTPYAFDSDTFTLTLNVTAGKVTSFDQTVTQSVFSEVPGPLPLLGAGAAFGFSRRIRSRIKASA